MSVRVVRPPAEEDPQKLSPEEVQRLWDSLAISGDEGEAYLDKRGLGSAVDGHLVRFTFNAHPERSVVGLWRNEYRVACLLTDVLGQPRGIQARLAREPRGDESAIRSVKGSSVSKAFYGSPQLIDAEPLVCVTEGMTDTLAVAAWTGGVEGLCVVGAPTRGALPKLAKELEAATTAVEGKLFVLFPKNDRPKNESRREFTTLKQLLAARGARVVLVSTHPEYKDVAAWRQAHPEAEWPPAEVSKALRPEPGEGLAAEAQPAVPAGLALPIPAEVRTERYAQDFTTLCALLDDRGVREAIMGPGTLTWCEMTWRVRHSGRELSEVDLSIIRLGLESQGRSTDGKPLKFTEEEIAKALALLARRAPVHPVRDWLKGLTWDGKQRIEGELAGAIGHEEGSFAARLLVRWMVAAVARAMEPGCKVDTVIVLTGPEQYRKSTFFEVLGGQWFTDTPVHVGDKDGKLIMRRCWIIEWAELEAMRRARDHEGLKGFLSSRVDMFRKPYGRDVVEAPRHCVIVGTTNHPDYLSDPTGTRRFWTIDITKKIDFQWVRAHREQLWAEAASVYHAAHACAECIPMLPDDRCPEHRWYLTDEEDAQRAEENKEHEAQHQWMDVISDWIDGHLILAQLTPEQVLVEAVGMDVADIRNADQQAAGVILRKLGWTRKRRRVGAEKVPKWVFIRSDSAEAS